jgi:hypothetical protein
LVEAPLPGRVIHGLHQPAQGVEGHLRLQGNAPERRPAGTHAGAVPFVQHESGNHPVRPAAQLEDDWFAAGLPLQEFPPVEPIPGRPAQAVEFSPGVYPVRVRSFRVPVHCDEKRILRNFQTIDPDLRGKNSLALLRVILLETDEHHVIC